MLRFERLAYDPAWWARALERCPDRTVYQTPEWLSFLAETQGGEIILAALYDGNSRVGFFTGLKVRKLGASLLGSPLPGWTTSYMGFNLEPGVPVAEAMDALRQFAFGDLGCVHFETMYRHFSLNDVSPDAEFREYRGLEIDLSRSEDELFARFQPACRTCIRKAIKSGVTIEQASADDGFAEDYYEQLEDVFAKQRLRPTYTIHRVRALIRHLQGTDKMLLLRAREPGGRAVATGISLAMYDRAFVWGGASWRNFQILRPNELLFWHAIKFWKSRGIRFFDMGGGGDYKRKYGGYPISVPWIRVSKSSILPIMRNAVATLVRARQRLGAVPYLARELRASWTGSRECLPSTDQ